MSTGTDDLAATLVARLRRAGSTVGTAESLTGGLVSAALTAVPGASAVVRGGVCAYATDVKAAVLGVDPGLLSARGAVDPDVALAMADGVRRLLGVTWGVATTGVAGPEPADGKAVGTVYVAVVGEHAREVRALQGEGDRSGIRSWTTEAALTLLLATAGETTRGTED